MSENVPRRAAFDDLRVGQWVAVWYDDDRAYVGRVAEIREHSANVSVHDGDEFPIFRSASNHDRERQVTILRDAPAPPVTVRREDYDKGQAALADYDQSHGNYGRGACVDALRALIDHADTGDTP